MAKASKLEVPLAATLLDFARVLIEGKAELDGDKVTPLDGVELSAKALESRLEIAMIVWNAVTFEQRGRGDGFVKDARFSIAAMGQAAAMNVFESLVQRKKGPFADDQRLLLKVSVKAVSEGRLWVRAKERKK